MLNVRANIRYVRALYDLGKEMNVTEQVYDDMKYLKILFKEDTELRVLLANPTIPKNIKRQALRLIFAGKINSLSLRFLDMLVQKNRESDVYLISMIYVHTYTKKNRISRVEVESAEALDEDTKEEIIAKIKSWGTDSVELSNKIKPDLIGGFTLRIDGTYIDLSVKSKLNTLKKELSKTVYQKK